MKTTLLLLTLLVTACGQSEVTLSGPDVPATPSCHSNCTLIVGPLYANCKRMGHGKRHCDKELSEFILKCTEGK